MGCCKDGAHTKCIERKLIRCQDPTASLREIGRIGEGGDEGPHPPQRSEGRACGSQTTCAPRYQPTPCNVPEPDEGENPMPTNKEGGEDRERSIGVDDRCENSLGDERIDRANQNHLMDSARLDASHYPER